MDLDEDEKRRTLACGEIEQAVSTVSPPLDNLEVSSLWLWTQQDFTKWLRGGRLIWIQGNAGAGKSTLAKSILAHTRKLKQDNIPQFFIFNNTSSSDWQKLMLEHLLDSEGVVLWLQGKPEAGKSTLVEALSSIRELEQDNITQFLISLPLYQRLCYTSSSDWQRPMLEHWLDSEGQVLWLQGKPGAGKTSGWSWHMHILTHFSGIIHRKTWGSGEEAPYGLMAHTPDRDRTQQCNTAPRDVGTNGIPEILQHHLNGSIVPSNSLGAPQKLDFVDGTPGNFLRCTQTVVSGKMWKKLMLLSPICFGIGVSAVTDNGTFQNFISPSFAASLGLRPYTESLQNTQNFLISVESPLFRIKLPKSNLISVQLWAHPTDSPSLETSPSTILLATFLCTTTVALLSQVGKKDAYQAHIIALCAGAAASAGLFLGGNIQALVLVYLFGGCIAGLAVSQLYHRFTAVSGKKEQQQQREHQTWLGEKM